MGESIKSVGYAFLFTAIIIVFVFTISRYIILQNNIQDNIWKDTFYYGINKGQIRTEGFPSIDEGSLDYTGYYDVASDGMLAREIKKSIGEYSKGIGANQYKIDLSDGIKYTISGKVSGSTDSIDNTRKILIKNSNK